MFSGRSIGAFFLAALEALNIAASSSVYDSTGYQLVDYLTDPYQIVDNTTEFIFGDDRIETDSEFLDRSTIIIDKDVVTIDGIPYTNVWLSTEAAEQFRTEGFDLKTAFALTSQNNGTFVSGAGFIGGVPVYQNPTSNVVKSPIYRADQANTVYETGKFKYYYTTTTGTYPSKRYYISYNGGTYTSAQEYPITSTSSGFMVPGQEFRDQNWAGFGGITSSTQVPNNMARADVPDTDVQQTPFSFDWVTGEIPADQALGENVGLNIQVPTTIINNFYVTYPEYDQPSVTIDLHDIDPSIIDDLIMPIVPVISDDDTTITFAEHETPTPPAAGTIANEPWVSLQNALNQIKEQIQIGNTIQNAIKASIDLLAPIISPINTTLTNIRNDISDLIDKIETGSIDFFRDVVRSIKVPFQRWFGILAQGVGIWHYVVEWVQYISAPFSWFWNVFASVNPILISPVYALFAAVLVIAIYRRFGR